MAARFARAKSGSSVLIEPNLIHQRISITGIAILRNHRPTTPAKLRNGASVKKKKVNKDQAITFR